MNVLSQIEESERLYKSTLEEFFLRVTGVSLESHGIEHHRRVWAFARRIISSPGFINTGSDTGFINKLLIASCLHDSGMIIDPGPRHGIHSRRLTEKYLYENGERAEDFIDMLDAIELHDVKEYHSDNAASSLEVVLNVADDLDAFGYTGIYRYLEIYIERKISYLTIGEKIRKNAESRYNNVEKILKAEPEIMVIHKKRYLTLDSFFRGYNAQVGEYSFGTGNPAGYCGVAELIGESVQNRSTLKELILRSSDSKYDATINHYFTQLRQELTHYSNGL